MTKKVICPDPAGDLSQGVVRGAQRLGGQIEGLMVELEPALGQRIAGLFERVDMARARGEGAFAGIVTLRQPAQRRVQGGQALA